MGAAMIPLVGPFPCAMAQRCYDLMLRKKSNLIVAADLQSSQSILDLANEVGPHIAVLKLHVDIISDFSHGFIADLQALSRQHQFLLFEDRKLADIGSTAQQQLAAGLYRIATWADMVTVHMVMGAGTLASLQPIAKAHDCGLILLAQLSNQGNLLGDQYLEQAGQMIDEAADQVMAVVSQSPIVTKKPVLHMMPGIHLKQTADGLDQRYRTPQQAVASGATLLIVGRGITRAGSCRDAAMQYQQVGWQALGLE